MRVNGWLIVDLHIGFTPTSIDLALLSKKRKKSNESLFWLWSKAVAIGSLGMIWWEGQIRRSVMALTRILRTRLGGMAENGDCKRLSGLGSGLGRCCWSWIWGRITLGHRSASTRLHGMDFARLGHVSITGVTEAWFYMRTPQKPGNASELCTNTVLVLAFVSGCHGIALQAISTSSSS